jgi:hypothetical protein
MEATMYAVGDRIIRKRDGESGFITDTRKVRALMVEIRWDATGIKQWLPSEEFKPWDRSDAPPPVQKTWLGRTTPIYLVELRRKNPLKKDPMREKRKAEERLADDLTGLSSRKKNRSRNKARKLIARWDTIYGSDGRPIAAFKTYTRREAKMLSERIDRDRM